ncbi:MAG: ATP-binding cassette domain-containing protein [Nannocystaceae bacterium]
MRLTIHALCCKIADAAILDGIDLELGSGDRLAVVGPSGAGKTMLLRCLLALLPPGAVVRGKLIWRKGGAVRTIRACDRSQLGALRGKFFAWIPQEAALSLDPLRRVGSQLQEVLRVHGNSESPHQLLDRVHLDASAARLFPAQLSGGMAQRVAIALALASHPLVLLADEPTTGLDTVVQRAVLSELVEICDAQDIAIMFVTHDLDAARYVCQRGVVMDSGRVVQVLDHLDPRIEPHDHPTTRLLKQAALRSYRIPPDTEATRHDV